MSAPTLADVLAANPELPAPRARTPGATSQEPWQATVFALTVQLHQRGHLTWQQWADALGARLATDPRPTPATDPEPANGPAAPRAARGVRRAPQAQPPGNDDPPGSSVGEDHYFRAWAAALADVLAELGLVEAGDIDRAERRWRAAAARTPHGQPIELVAKD